MADRRLPDRRDAHRGGAGTCPQAGIRLDLLYDRQFASVALMGFTPLMVRHLDIRSVVGAGLELMALNCWIDTDLTAHETSHDEIGVKGMLGRH